MTQIAQAFAKTGKTVVSYNEIYDIGIVELKLSNLSDEISKLNDSRQYRRFSLPCGQGAVVNVTIFAKEYRFLKRLQKNRTYKVYAKITQKTIANGSVRTFYNLDLELVHPNAVVYAAVKVVQNVSKTEEGRVFNCPQGGAIVANFA